MLSMSRVVMRTMSVIRKILGDSCADNMSNHINLFEFAATSDTFGTHTNSRLIFSVELTLRGLHMHAAISMKSCSMRNSISTDQEAEVHMRRRIKTLWQPGFIFQCTYFIFIAYFHGTSLVTSN